MAHTTSAQSPAASPATARFQAWEVVREAEVALHAAEQLSARSIRRERTREATNRLQAALRVYLAVAAEPRP